MIRVRKAAQRGRTNIGWLDSRHSFSFGGYRDPEVMGFRSLRVINDDRVRGGGMFPPHPHRDMEIISYVLDGHMEHKDSTGAGGVIGPGDVQRMTAGSGVTHSEANHSRTEPVHFLQIWIVPAQRGLEPGYEQRNFPPGSKRGRLCPIASGRAGPEGPGQTPSPVADGGGGGSAAAPAGKGTGRDDPQPLTIHQDAAIYAAILGPGQSVTHQTRPGRGLWIQIARGRAVLRAGSESHTLQEGDGAAVEDEGRIDLAGEEEAEMLVFDLA